jgi:hypothetical protein
MNGKRRRFIVQKYIFAFHVHLNQVFLHQAYA